MASLSLLPLDLVKEIVAHLDFNSLALLFWSFDARMQHILVSGAVTRISLTMEVSRHLYPAHWYFLRSLKAIDHLALELPVDTSWPPPKLSVVALPSPRHLSWNIPYSFGRIYDHDYIRFFQHIETIQLKVKNWDKPSVLLHALSNLPQRLQSFRIFVTARNGESPPNWAELLTILPNSLIELALESDPPSEISLRIICDTMPKLEVLDVKGSNCSSSGTRLKLPPSLTYLAAPLTHLQELNLLESNVTFLEVHNRIEAEDEQQLDLQKIAPRNLSQLRLSIVPSVETLPIYITELSAHCLHDCSLGILLERLILPLNSLQSLTITLDSKPAPLPISVARLPTSLCHLHLRLLKDVLTPESVKQIFGATALSSARLRVELDFVSLPLERIIEYSLVFPRTIIKVKEMCVISAIWISVLLKVVPRLSSVVPDVHEMLFAISNWLYGAGRVQFTMCLCARCFRYWMANRGEKSAISVTKHLTVPLWQFSYGGIAFRGDGSHDWSPCSDTSFYLPSLESFHLSTPPDGYLLPHLTSLPFERSISWLHKLTVLDFGAAQNFPHSQSFWDAIPKSVTVLKSTYDPQPQVKFGGSVDCRGLGLHALGRRGNCPPLRLVTLDMPHYAYPLRSLTKLVSVETLTNMCITVADEDTAIFEFALNPTIVFPRLKTIQLKAIPTVTGKLIANYPPRVTLKVLEQEVAQVLWCAKVQIFGYLYSDTIAIHPAATHAIFDDIHYTVFSEVEYLGCESKQLQEIQAFATGTDQLSLPPNLPSLDLKMLCKTFRREKFPPSIAKLPPKLRHWSISVKERRGVYYSPATVPIIRQEEFPHALESITVHAAKSQKVIQNLPLAATRLHHLLLVEITTANDVFVDSLCSALSNSTRVKLQTAQFSGLLLPLDLVHLNWKVVVEHCMALEKRFALLEIDEWTTVHDSGERKMEILSEHLKSVCLKPGSLEGVARRVCKKRFKQLVEEEVTILTIQRPCLPKTSLECALLPNRLRVLNIGVNGKPKPHEVETTVELRGVGRLRNLWEVNVGPMVRVTTPRAKKITFTINK